MECGRHTQPNLPWPAIAHPDDQPIVDDDSFLWAWTVKEAVAKCCGEGLTLDFTRLRLWRGEEQPLRCGDGRRQWQAWHGMLDAHTHLAVATATAWSRLRLVTVSTPLVI
ncbi:4'-phosphopantetheinyl transferase superfamily protein [Chitinivorax sp. PXF-14]|uniref:4'-phosphopantetheinyl transferase family protein n=1 Tax=Chitinivorax sp. PXF-14 TaxID=3230488 RepID=UPI00346771DC